MRNFIILLIVGFFISLSVEAQTISGIITKDGLPVRGITVLGSNGLRTAYTNREGRFVFRGVQPGNYEITPYPFKHVDVEPRSAFIAFNELTNQDDLSFSLITLPTTQTLLRGRLRRLDNEALANAIVDISANNGSRFVDRNGVFTDTSLPEGRYVITPFASGYTFSPSYLQTKLRAGKPLRPSFSAFKVKPGDTYATFLGGVFNLRAEVTANSCVSPITSLSGSMGVSQFRNRVSVKLPYLSTLRGTANQGGFSLASTAFRRFCRVRSNITTTFESRDNGTVSGTLQFNCLFQQPCETSVQGIFSRL